MAAYLYTIIEGNEGFGGYISMDGAKRTEKVEHGMYYKIEPGKHLFEIYTTSDSQRGMANFQGKLYANTSSSGAILDAIERKQIIDGMGDCYTIEARVGENEMIAICITSRDNAILVAPEYKVVELTQEDIDGIEEVFKAAEEEHEKWKNTPVRSVKKIVFGAILMYLGFGCVMYVLSGEMNVVDSSNGPAAIIGAIAVFLGMGVGGLLLFIDGLKKKLRRK